MSLLATTLDSLCLGRLTVEQPEKGYRFNTDTVLLAASVTAKPGETVLELGCGVGAVLMAACVRCPEFIYTGIERETFYADLAVKNVIANGFENQIRIINGDIADKALFKQIGSFDHVMANPPYFQPHPNNDVHELRRAAREEDVDVAEWIQSANRFLKPKGTVTFIHTVDRLQELIQGFENFSGGIEVFPIFPNEGKAAKRVLVRAVKGSKKPLSLLPGLVIHDKGDTYYTIRAEQVIRHGQGLWQE